MLGAAEVVASCLPSTLSWTSLGVVAVRVRPSRLNAVERLTDSWADKPCSPISAKASSTVVAVVQKVFSTPSMITVIGRP